MQRIGPYELIRQLDDGVMGQRWLSERTGPHGAESFTVELLQGRALAIPEVRSLLFDELRRAIPIRNSNIVALIELVELEGRWVLVSEAIDGLSLAEFAARVHAGGQRMTYDLVAYVIGEILRGIGFVHELTIGGRPAGMLHGAISPREVLLATSGEVRLRGFGLARIAAELSRAPAAMRYMPPEQLTGGRGPSLDLFAIGGILHELLDGHEFRVQAADDVQLHAAIRDGQTAQLSPQHPNYPVQLESLRAGLLAPQIEFRIPSAHDALALLREWPGYRNAGGELANLVRGFLGPASAKAPGRESSATVFIDQSKLFVEPTDAAPAAPTVDGIPPSDVKDKGKPAPATIALVAGVTALGLTFVIVGLGFALGWWGPLAKSELAEAELAEVEQPTPPAKPEPEPLPALPGAEPTPEIDAIAAPAKLDTPEGPLPGAELTPEAPATRSSTGTSSGSGGGGSGTGGGATTSARKGVHVTFTERHYETVQVKIDRRVIEFDGRKAVTLSPGAHVLYLREGKDQDWRPAGKITLEAGKRYEITMLDPPLAMVKTL